MRRIAIMLDPQVRGIFRSLGHGEALGTSLMWWGGTPRTGADMKTVQSLMRHANISVTMDKYVQAVTPAKRQAQRSVAGLLLDPNGPMLLKSNTASC